ncbi:unnamed protein product [Cyprideis torosa]|uniref:Uncharacterized protein n=1 Tax=Cyprideis torosa TaxID=163714 RepID=A0A7R8ZJA9_9CRUS|nr:unnamed protein product [Cyprideis torosa]CAG0879419.1 unnamed protein product [Cyprideis torosa]
MTEFTNKVLQVAVAQICQNIGYSAVHQTPLDILVDVTRRYVHDIGKNIRRYNDHFGHACLAAEDIPLALRGLGVDLSDIADYVNNVEPAPFPGDVPPVYPIPQESNLNFLKPGSREVVTRAVHIHEHLPAMYPEKEEDYDSAAKSTSGESSKDSKTLLPPPKTESPVNGDPGSSKKRPAVSDEVGRPSREPSSIQMTTGGFLSSAREGKGPEPRWPNDWASANEVTTTPLVGDMFSLSASTQKSATSSKKLLKAAVTGAAIGSPRPRKREGTLRKTGKKRPPRTKPPTPRPPSSHSHSHTHTHPPTSTASHSHSHPHPSPAPPPQPPAPPAQKPKKRRPPPPPLVGGLSASLPRIPKKKKRHGEEEGELSYSDDEDTPPGVLAPPAPSTASAPPDAVEIVQREPDSTTHIDNEPDQGQKLSIFKRMAPPRPPEPTSVNAPLPRADEEYSDLSSSSGSELLSERLETKKPKKRTKVKPSSEKPQPPKKKNKLDVLAFVKKIEKRKPSPPRPKSPEDIPSSSPSPPLSPAAPFDFDDHHVDSPPSPLPPRVRKQAPPPAPQEPSSTTSPRPKTPDLSPSALIAAAVKSKQQRYVHHGRRSPSSSSSSSREATPPPAQAPPPPPPAPPSDSEDRESEGPDQDQDDLKSDSLFSGLLSKAPAHPSFIPSTLSTPLLSPGSIPPSFGGPPSFSHSPVIPPPRPPSALSAHKRTPSPYLPPRDVEEDSISESEIANAPLSAFSPPSVAHQAASSKKAKRHHKDKESRHKKTKEKVKEKKRKKDEDGATTKSSSSSVSKKKKTKEEKQQPVTAHVPAPPSAPPTPSIPPVTVTEERVVPKLTFKFPPSETRTSSPSTSSQEEASPADTPKITIKPLKRPPESMPVTEPLVLSIPSLNKVSKESKRKSGSPSPGISIKRGPGRPPKHKPPGGKGLMSPPLAPTGGGLVAPMESAVAPTLPPGKVAPLLPSSTSYAPVVGPAAGIITETVGSYIDEAGNKIWICPACGRQDDGSPMIGCDNCDDWYHWGCVGITVEPKEDEDWFCNRCKAKGSGPKMPTMSSSARKKGSGSKKKTKK